MARIESTIRSTSIFSRTPRRHRCRQLAAILQLDKASPGSAAMDAIFEVGFDRSSRGGALAFLPCPTCPSSAPAATYCHRFRQAEHGRRMSASRWTCLGRGRVGWRRYGAFMGSGATALSDVRHTEPEALGNLTAVLQLCAAGKLRCSEKTRRPSAATIRTVAEALVAGDFYPDEAIASFAWPLLLQAGGLARLDGPRLTLTPKGRKAIGQPGARGDPWAVGTLAPARPDRRVQPRGADQGPEVRRGAERSRATTPGRGCRARPLPARRVDRRGRLCSPRCAAPT